MNEQEAKTLMVEMGYAINEKDRIIEVNMDRKFKMNYVFTTLIFFMTLVVILVLSLLLRGSLDKKHEIKVVKDTKIVYVDKIKIVEVPKVVYSKNPRYIDISKFRYMYTKFRGKEVCEYYSLKGRTNEFYTVCKPR